MPSPETIHRALDSFRIETPSWGYSDTGTRFGKFHQPASAIDLDDKLADAAHVHRLTGCCPTVATHVLWDFAPGSIDWAWGPLVWPTYPWNAEPISPELLLIPALIVLAILVGLLPAIAAYRTDVSKSLAP